MNNRHLPMTAASAEDAGSHIPYPAGGIEAASNA
jgi:hypothetical protein